MKKKIEFEFLVVHGDEPVVIPAGWDEYTRIVTDWGAGGTDGAPYGEQVIFILPLDVIASSSCRDLETEKEVAIEGILLGRLSKSLPSRKRFQ